MLTESATLDRIADALDGLPTLTESDRAHIFHAIDTAPCAASWAHARHIDLAGGTLLRPLTLSECVRWVEVPGDLTILAGLNYAIGVLT